MHSRITAALMVAAIVVAAVGSGVALGASTGPAAKACVSRSSHRLALLKKGKCAAGYSRTTLGAQGPRGPRGNVGPQGPGATYQEQFVSNDDIQDRLEHNVAGLAVTAVCGETANVSIDLVPASASDTLDAYGTRTQSTTIVAVSLQAVSDLAATSSQDVALDVIARAGSGSYVDLHIAGVWADNKCTITEVAVPTKLAT